MLVSSVSSGFQNFATQGRNGQEASITHGKASDDNKVSPSVKDKDKDKEMSRSNKDNLNQEQNEEIRKLAARDREVRAHEAAHMAAGGSLTGPASFSYSKGPDGKSYASSGEVSIDTSEVAGDPQATLIKANQIRAAALAPAQPSNTDQSVAAKAAQMATETRAQILTDNNAEASNDTKAQETQNSVNPNNGAVAYQASTSTPPPATIDILA